MFMPSSMLPRCEGAYHTYLAVFSACMLNAQRESDCGVQNSCR